MKIGSRYTLERPTTGEVLGTLTVTATEMFAVTGTFVASPAFDPYRDDPRFAQIVERRERFEAQNARRAEAERPWVP